MLAPFTRVVSPLYTHLRASSPFFFFTDPATTAIYTLSLHDALPICPMSSDGFMTAVTASSGRSPAWPGSRRPGHLPAPLPAPQRSEEHTSELQSRENLVCRLLLEKKKKKEAYENMSL